ncbi:hypothetical protein MLD38_036611 [Melastoma candidum]|uniref:Uncharacterized protein n=1 Tax=Melastoma candidum TaxID=119954 RepID=A0ACB9LKF5_9MYRT|nr:hypothetical protein MLD38_036611 [Melastoma candidum]
MVSGSIPSDIGNLNSLQQFYLQSNSITGLIPRTTGNMSSLVRLWLLDNQIHGPMPSEIGKMGSPFELNLSNNDLNGSIPKAVGNLTGLNYLYFNGNRLSGSIPTEVGNMQHLSDFQLLANKLTGPIPASIGNMTSLTSLKLQSNYLPAMEQLLHWPPTIRYMLGGRLQNNQLTGTLMESPGVYPNLDYLELSNNRLHGSLPTDFSERINLAGNNLSGSIPRELKACWYLEHLYFGSNNLGERIPAEIGNLQDLLYLDFSYNLLIGEIPVQLGNLINLEVLNLSHNRLTGAFPSTFNGMYGLIAINVFYNQLEGPLPDIPAFRNASYDAVRGNKGLCGNIKFLVPCSALEPRQSEGNGGRKRFLLISLVPLNCVIVLFVILGGLFIMFRRSNNTRSAPDEAGNERVWMIWSYDSEMAYKSIIEATENFDDKYCIGVGGQGSVYRANIATGEVFWIKKLKQDPDAKMMSQKAFDREIHALTEIQYRNIVRLYGFCSSRQHTFLVYEYLEPGSLESILKDGERVRQFDWWKRLNFVKGIANALSYLRHDCHTAIIHGDVSSKNILLDDEWEANISDFGTAQTLHGRVYFCRTDGRISYPDRVVVEEVVHVMKMAFSCISISPEDWPSMRQVSQGLSSWRNLAIPAVLNDATLNKLFDFRGFNC